MTESNSAQPRKSYSTSRRTSNDVAATRHLRLLISGIAENAELSPGERWERINNFDKLLEDAERKLHYNNGGRADDHLIVEGRKGRRFAGGVMKKETKTEKENMRTIRGRSILSRFRPGGKSKWDDADEAAEERGPESLQDGPDDLESCDRSPCTDTETQKEILAYPSVAPPPIPPPSEEDPGSDSIMDVRFANSRDYTVSICSLRSLGTFERDFIDNIVAEQQQDIISVSTFERDVGARGVTLEMIRGPSDFRRDDVDSILSETTFERDARRAGLEEGAALAPPWQVEFSNDDAVMMQEEEEDDLSEDLRSETTFEREAQDKMNGGPVMGSPAVDSIDSLRSVSTFEKDAVARNALAIKLGRVSSSNIHSVIVENLSSRSECTFERDQRLRVSGDRSSRIHPTASAGSAPGRIVMKMSAPATPPVVTDALSTESPTIYERDALQRRQCGSFGLHALFTNQSDEGTDDRSRFERDVSRNMSLEIRVPVVSGKKPPIPRINDLVVELSPERIEALRRGKVKRRGVSKLLCHCGLS